MKPDAIDEEKSLNDAKLPETAAELALPNPRQGPRGILSFGDSESTRHSWENMASRKIVPDVIGNSQDDQVTVRTLTSAESASTPR